MIEVKQSFRGGLDLDTALESVKPESYVDALNITRFSQSQNSNEDINNIIGNRIISYSFAPGRNKSIGAIANTLRGTVLSLVWHEYSKHSIVQYNIAARTATKVFENLTDSDGEDILGFTEDGKISSINIYNKDDGDLLFFLDSLGRPTMLNITRLIAGEYTPVTREMIDVISMPPLSPPTCVYDADTGRRVNNLTNKLFRFKYRWVYDENQKSVWSPISYVPLPINILSTTYTSVVTNNNVIRITYNTGGIDVKSIELAMSYVNKTNVWSDFQLVQTVIKDDGFTEIPSNFDWNFSFYNDSTYPVVEIEESNLLFDWVPRYAKSQEMPNGNYICYAGITEGYSRALVPNVEINVLTVAAGSGGGSVGSLTAVATSIFNIGIETWQIAFTGTPATGTVVQVFALTNPGGVSTLVGAYTTVAGDTPNSVVDGLFISMNSIGITIFEVDLGTTIQFSLTPSYDFSQVTVTPPALTAASQSIATWKWSTEREIAIVYFDQHGRTNGVLYHEKVTFPAYAENGSQQCMLPYIQVFISHTPPIWAYSFQFLFSKEPTQYLFWETVDVNTTESDYIYFDVTNIDLNATKTPTVAQVLSYTFQDGDRLRLIRKMSDNTVYPDTYDAAVEGKVTDPVINGVTQTGKTFIKIKNVAPFSSVNYSTDNFVIELYRPGVQLPNSQNLVFYEFGAQYAIIDPGTEDRVHAGMISNQTTGGSPSEYQFYNGDSYFRPRNIYLTNSGSATFNVQDRNFVDFFISAVSSIDGRPNAVDADAKEAYYPTLIRHSLDFQANTNINRLNRFFPENFDEYEASFGDVMRLKVRDRAMRVFQKLKTGVVNIFSKIGKSQDGDTITIVTNDLLNPISYYVGDYGIGDAAESLTSFNFADYFCDTNRGAICRVSLNGVENLSAIYKMNSWATREMPLRTGTSNIYGAFDQRTNKYLIALESATGSSAQTLSFAEDTGKGFPTFESFLSLYPEMMVTIGTLLCSFHDGQIWTHDSSTYNNFFGVQYDSHIDVLFNDKPVFDKTFLSVEQRSSSIWDCPEITSQAISYGSTQQQSNLVQNDFQLLEGKYSATFLGDTNSPGGVGNGWSLKGCFIRIKFRKQNASESVNLSQVGVYYVESNRNNR